MQDVSFYRLSYDVAVKAAEEWVFAPFGDVAVDEFVETIEVFDLCEVVEEGAVEVIEGCHIGR